MREDLRVPIHPDETLDSLLQTPLRIIQKKRGYRYSIDTVLLAHFCRLQKGDRAIDLGTGSGIIPILLAMRDPATSIVGVEIQADLWDVAGRNVTLNDMDGRITVMCCDVKDLEDSLKKASFDVATTNPPYRPILAGRISPDSQKAFARHEIMASLADMARVASLLLRPKGRFHVIYPASRTVDLLVLLRDSGLEPKRLRLVHSNVKKDAELVLAEAIKGGRRELRVMKPLFIYDLQGHYTEEMERIYAMS